MKEEMIKKYSERLKTLKTNRAETVDTNTDAVNELYDNLIQMTAEFIRDLKSLPVYKGEKYSLYGELLNDNNIMSHIFLTCLPQDLSVKIAGESSAMPREKIEKRTIEIALVIEGVSVNPKPFFNLFVDQYDDLVKKTATEIVKEQTSEKLTEVSNKIFEINDIMNSFAVDINWEVDNPFAKAVKDEIK